MADKETTERRVYVLPKELLDRLRAYMTRNGIAAEVEAVRRLLDTALQMRDSTTDILATLKAKFAEEKDLRLLARDVLAAHVLVREVHYEDDAIAFCLSGDEYNRYGRIDGAGRIFLGSNWEDWSEVGKPARSVPSRGGGPSWDTPKGGDLDDEIPF